MALMQVYRSLTVAAGPLTSIYLGQRRRIGKEDPRARRRAPRPRLAARGRRGALVWLHAASVGEAASMLALIDRLLVERPRLRVLVTTGTVTSARLIANRADRPGRA